MLKDLQLNHKFLRDSYLVIVTLLLFLLTLNILAPFATTLLLAFLVVALFQPVYQRLNKLAGAAFATIFSTLSVILVIVIPLILMGTLLVNELSNFTVQFTQFIRDEVILTDAERAEGKQSEFVTRINNVLVSVNPSLQIDQEDFDNFLRSQVQNLDVRIVSALQPITENIAGLFVQLIVFLIALVFLFKDYRKIPRMVRKYLPLDDEVEDLLLEEFISTGKGVIKGIFLVALVHAVTVTLLMYLFGAQALGVIFLAVFVASTIPGGSQLVWIPASILIGATFGALPAVALFILCFISMNAIDTLVRPALTGGSTKMNSLLSVISILGGLAVYGVAGLLYGPLIVVMFMTIISAYNRRFKAD